MYKQLILVFVGGGLGSVLRFGVGRLLQHYQFNTAFPWATFSVNIIGSFMIGLLLAFEFRMTDNFNLVKSFLIIGFCGGFTTFSTFAFENFYLIKQGQLGIFLTYSFISLIMGITAVYLGWQINQ
jgi:CrcB protein